MEKNSNKGIQYFDLTAPQENIWLTEQFYNDTNINNITGYFNIKHKIDIKLLQKAINIFIKNNDALRTKFIKDESGNLKQYFSEFNEEKSEYIYVNSQNELDNLKQTILNKKFDIIQKKLYNFYIYNLNDQEGGFIFSCHHLIGDAWSMSILIDNIADIYYNLINNQTINQNNSKIPQYQKYIDKEKKYLNSNKYKKDISYWENIFQAKLDIENKDKENNSIEANRIEFLMDNTIIKKIKNLDHSFFNIYISAFSMYMSEINNSKNLLIGVPVLNRSNFEEKHTIGMFVNTVPLSVNIDNTLSFKQFLEQNKQNEYSLFKHQRISYEKLLSIASTNNSDIKYLFDTVISYQNARDNNKESSLNYSTGWIFNKCTSNSLDIHITDLDNTGTLKIFYDYQINKYTEKDIYNIHNHIINIINQIIENNNILLKDIQIITETEKNDLLSINNLQINFDETTTIIDMFKKQVEKKPNDIAICFENQKITYKELDIKSDTIAGLLLKNQIKKSDIVAILLPRSLDLFSTILGILKSGATYLPIDTEFPDQRIDYMLHDSKSMFCITNFEQSKRIKNINTLLLEDINNTPPISFNKYDIKSNNNCYIIYTSGSTGNPKGVISTHINVINYTYAFQNEFHLTDSDTVLQQFTPSFDAFVEEFYPALLNGIKIFAVSKNTIYNFKELENYINNNNITLVSCSPLLLNELNKLDTLKSVKTFISGGDTLKPSFYSNLIKYANVYNTYGPTETTVCSTYHKCTSNETSIIPIGKTIANYKNFIVSENNHLIPKGQIGELCIGGKGLSKGYLNNEKLSNEKFITLPIINEKVYKTGDLCRINSNNEIEFIGRKDSQLKIRGYRVSLNEIEKMLNQYPGITNSVVIDFEDENNKKKLCAYYVGIINITAKEIQEYLEKVLPAYMIPSLFIRIENIPITINGKVDRKNLPNPQTFYDKRETKYIAPSNEIELKLEQLWKKILNLKQISIEDNLFELGADSLSVIQFQTLTVNETWKIDAQDIYSNSTLQKLAKKIESQLNITNTSNKKFKEINISSISLPIKIEKTENILLTGATGFLGIHILNNLLENSKSNIYCLVRGKDKNFAQKRLLDLYHFYFNKNLLNNNRIKILFGDITKEDLGINATEYKKLTQKINAVIHTAATVKHYGNSELFNKINVIGTQNLIKFCITSKSKLYHVSTISVSGQTTYNNEDKKFTENDFWINQNYQDNPYVKSKFEAEYYIYEAIINNNLYAKILRVGNLTGRYNDGTFQKNIETNAFYKKIQTIIELKKIPESIINIKIDFTPIDMVSDAINKIIFKDNSNQIVYHLYNNTLSLKELINILNSIGFQIQILLKEKFTSEKETELLNSLIYNIYPTENKNKIQLTNTISNNQLSKLGFYWKSTNREYILKLINYMKQINFIKEENKNFE